MDFIQCDCGFKISCFSYIFLLTVVLREYIFYQDMCLRKSSKQCSHSKICMGQEHARA